MSPIVENNLKEIVVLFRKNQVKNAYLFGSAVSGNTKENSDIDFLIDFNDELDPIKYGENYFALAHSLETLLGRKVDLLTSKSLQNPFLIESINANKVFLYGN